MFTFRDLLREAGVTIIVAVLVFGLINYAMDSDNTIIKLLFLLLVLIVGVIAAILMGMVE